MGVGHLLPAEGGQRIQASLPLGDCAAVFEAREAEKGRFQTHESGLFVGDQRPGMWSSIHQSEAGGRFL